MTSGASLPRIGIDPLSACASIIEMKFNNTSLSIGTCFFWEAANRVFLVTNWHNVTGKNPISGKHISNTAAEPNAVIFDGWQYQNLNARLTATMVLDDANGPLWLEHPIHRQKVDAVCLELPSNFAPHVFPINTQANQPITTRIADEVFVLGYPMGIGPNRLPIWKRASVASEPDIDIDNLPKIYVDTATASGMSGSPVIRRSNSGLMDDGTSVMGFSPMTRLMGIYSGRMTSGNSTDAQLGIVWKYRVIDEIIQGGLRGSR